MLRGPGDDLHRTYMSLIMMSAQEWVYRRRDVFWVCFGRCIRVTICMSRCVALRRVASPSREAQLYCYTRTVCCAASKACCLPASIFAGRTCLTVSSLLQAPVHARECNALSPRALWPLQQKAETRWYRRCTASHPPWLESVNEQHEHDLDVMLS